jgi:hypothetical protein
MENNQQEDVTLTPYFLLEDNSYVFIVKLEFFLERMLKKYG